MIVEHGIVGPAKATDVDPISERYDEDEEEGIKMELAVCIYAFYCMYIIYMMYIMYLYIYDALLLHDVHVHYVRNYIYMYMYCLRCLSFFQISYVYMMYMMYMYIMYIIICTCT